MLGKIEGRRMGQRRMKWLDGIIGLMDMSLSELWEMVKDREASRGVTQTPHGGVASTLEGSGSPAPDFMLQTGMNSVTVTLAHRALGSTEQWRCGLTGGTGKSPSQQRERLFVLG